MSDGAGGDQRLMELHLQAQRALVTSLSNPAPLSMYSQPDAFGGMGSNLKFADINTHAEFENRTRMLEEKSINEASSSTTAPKTPTPAVSLSPYRFLQIYGRMKIYTELEMSWINYHRIRAPYEGDHSTSTYPEILKLSKYIVTSSLEQKVTRRCLMDHVPLGSLGDAMRHTHGEFAGVSPNTLLKEEMGKEVSSQILQESTTRYVQLFRPHQEHHQMMHTPNPHNDPTVNAMKQKVASQPPEWTSLHDVWAAVFVERELKSQFDEEFTPLYMLQHSQTLQFQTHFLSSTHMMRPKRPIIVRLVGGWFVQHHAVTRRGYKRDKLCLTPCPQGKRDVYTRPPCTLGVCDDVRARGDVQDSLVRCTAGRPSSWPLPTAARPSRRKTCRPFCDSCVNSPTPPPRSRPQTQCLPRPLCSGRLPHTQPSWTSFARRSAS